MTTLHIEWTDDVAPIDATFPDHIGAARVAEAILDSHPDARVTIDGKQWHGEAKAETRRSGWEHDHSDAARWGYDVDGYAQLRSFR